MYFMNYQETN